jgi:poly(A) polymerase Pap1
MYILKSVKNFEVFSLSMRILKLWARQRGIYSTNFGYLNGITLSIMLAYAENSITDKQYINYNPNNIMLTKTSEKYDKDEMVDLLISAFFKIFSDWNWNSENPVCIH